MLRIEYGKIHHISFGLGGYRDEMIGINFVLSGRGWEVTDFWGNWSIESEPSVKWTDQQRTNDPGSVCLRVANLFQVANVKTLQDLCNIPVAVTFNEKGDLKSWKIFQDVL